MKKILIVLGATGGHIFPGLAIAKNFKKMNEEIVVSFVNTKNIKIGFLKIEPSQELFEINSLGFKGKPFLLKIKSLLVLVISIFQSNKIINNFKPDAIIGTGSFVALPVSLCGFLKGSKIFTIEGNSVPGLSNRLIGRFCKNILINFDESKKYFPEKKCLTSGFPVREFLIEKSDNPKKDLLILGGSQGSEILNSKVLLAIQSMLEKLKDEFRASEKTISIIHQTGVKDQERINNYYLKLKKEYNFLEFKTYDFIQNLHKYYSSCKVLISRAGASTTSEIMEFPILPILVPIKMSTNNHQYLNAIELSNKKLAMIHLENEEGVILCNKIINLLFNDEISLLYKKSKNSINQNESAVDKICATIVKEIT